MGAYCDDCDMEVSVGINYHLQEYVCCRCNAILIDATSDDYDND